MHLGELALDGRVRPVRGVLPAVAAAVAAGSPDVVVPAGNAAEAALVPGARVRAVHHLAEVVRAYGGIAQAAAARAPPRRSRRPCRRAATPGSRTSPTSSARTRPASPSRSPPRAGTTSSSSGRRAPARRCSPPGCPGCCRTSPTPRRSRSPPSTPWPARSIPTAGCCAGRRSRTRTTPPPRPRSSAAGRDCRVPARPAAPTAGCSSSTRRRSSRPRVLETLRQPLEHGELVLHRAAGAARYPARFQLVLAANPCPCGKAVGKGLRCTCSPAERRRYLARLSGPLLDRIDIQVDVAPVTRADARAGRPARDVGDRRRPGGRRPHPPGGPAGRHAVAAERRGARVVAARARGRPAHRRAPLPRPGARPRAR